MKKFMDRKEMDEKAWMKIMDEKSVDEILWMKKWSHVALSAKKMSMWTSLWHCLGSLKDPVFPNVFLNIMPKHAIFFDVLGLSILTKKTRNQSRRRVIPLQTLNAVFLDIKKKHVFLLVVP